MKLTLLLLLCSSFFSCKKEENPFEVKFLGAGTNDYRIIPEYEKSKGVVFSPDNNLLMGEYTNIPNSKEYYIQYRDEYVNLVKSIVQNQPNLTYVFYFDDNMQVNGVKNKELWSKLMKFGSSSKIKKILPQSNERSPYQWTRDFVPIIVENTSNKIKSYWNYDTEGKGMNHKVMDEFNYSELKEIKKPFAFDGGNIMVNNHGDCFIAFKDHIGEILGEELETFKQVCSNIYQMPAIPFEGTGHVDLFAKLLTDNEILVSTYSSDSFLVYKAVAEISYTCSQEQIQKKNWNECNSKQSRFNKMPRTIESYERTSDGTLRIYSKKELISFFKQKIQGENVSYLISRAGSLIDFDFEFNPKLAKHTQSIVNFFEEKNFKVFKVKAPLPIAEFRKEYFEDESGKVVNIDATISFNFRSYTNSLILNEQVFIPAYDNTGLKQTNEEVFKLYEKFPYKPISIPINYLTDSGGAVHCATQQVSDN